jgi:ABC-type Na+ efflux pump permease subunit
MASYKDPSFEERTALARQAREKALAKLAAKPPLDPAVVAERQAAQAAREKAQAEKSAAKKAAIEQAKADKAAAAEAAKAPVVSEEELKAARDARYAARKKRKG